MAFVPLWVKLPPTFSVSPAGTVTVPLLASVPAMISCEPLWVKLPPLAMVRVLPLFTLSVLLLFKVPFTVRVLFTVTVPFT